LFKAYGYFTTMTDLISTRDLNPTGTIKERINVGKARSNGVELSYVQPFMNRFKLLANYTLSDTKVLENQYDPGSIGKHLTSVPKHMANLGLSYDDSVYYATFGLQYSSKRYFLANNSDTVSGVLGSYDPYTLANVKIGYRATKQWDISLAVSNLFDKEFYNSIKTEGRAWYLQASFKY
jgi:iron complex outermembrane recepter protein